MYLRGSDLSIAILALKMEKKNNGNEKSYKNQTKK